MSEKRASGIGTALLTYFQDRPGKVVTIDNLVQHFKLDRKKLLGNMYNVKIKFPEIEQLQQGTWRLNESAQATKKNGRELLLLEVLKETDQATIAMDEDGNVYKITLLG